MQGCGLSRQLSVNSSTKKNHNNLEGKNKINFRVYSHTFKTENSVEIKLSFSTELKNRVSVRLGKIKKITEEAFSFCDLLFKILLLAIENCAIF